KGPQEAHLLPPDAREGARVRISPRVLTLLRLCENRDGTDVQRQPLPQKGSKIWKTNNGLGFIWIPGRLTAGHVSLTDAMRAAVLPWESSEGLYRFRWGPSRSAAGDHNDKTSRGFRSFRAASAKRAWCRGQHASLSRRRSGVQIPLSVFSSTIEFEN